LTPKVAFLSIVEKVVSEVGGNCSWTSWRILQMRAIERSTRPVNTAMVVVSRRARIWTRLNFCELKGMWRTLTIPYLGFVNFGKSCTE
jgi:hypothetical protein